MAKDIIEVQEQAEQQLAQMKNFYDMEKQQLEGRITEEKERASRRISSV